MLQFAANISMMYPEFEFIDRFAQASKDGFSAVEILFPYAFSTDALRNQLTENHLKLVLLNAKAGDFDHGERGTACLPGREQEFREGFLESLEYAKALNCDQIHVLAGNKPSDLPYEALEELYLTNLLWASEQAKNAAVKVLIEPINTRDMPGYFLNYQEQAHAIVEKVGMENLKVQMDLYHCQIMEGDLAKKIQHYLPSGRVSHLQIAGVPERHEPNIGELNYPYLFSVIEKLGYNGYIGCEYRPSRGKTPNSTANGLDWFKSLRD